MKTITIFLIVCSMLLLSGCTGRQSALPDVRSVYFWRTTLALDSTERQFIADHTIQRVYLHLFDVVMRDGEASPSGSIDIQQTLPTGIEAVPVVFINQDVTLSAVLADRMIQRITGMMQRRGMEWQEVQVDFDWTQRNMQRYYDFLEVLRDRLHKQHKHLSVTVRLHQLAMKLPPADSGTLMVYNIGNYSDPNEPNSILSVANLKPYLQHLKKYELPLTVALPLYEWCLAFHDGRFINIARDVNLADTSLYEKKIVNSVAGDTYIVKRYHVSMSKGVTMGEGVRLFPGDVIRHEGCSPMLLDSVQTLLRRNMPSGTPVILYHLDRNIIRNYNKGEIESLF